MHASHGWDLIGFRAGDVIVSEDGLILTAAHVITGEDLFSKSGPLEAKVSSCPSGWGRQAAVTSGSELDDDVGMVKITDKGPNGVAEAALPPTAKSANLKKSQWVVSLGHPGGLKSGRAPWPVSAGSRITRRTSFARTAPLSEATRAGRSLTSTAT